MNITFSFFRVYVFILYLLILFMSYFMGFIFPFIF